MSPVYVNGVEQGGGLAFVNGWTLDKLLKGAGAGVDPTEIDVPSGGYTEGARVYHDANQSTTDATWFTVALNSERYDTDAIHDPVTNNSRLTCRTAGKYLIIALIAWATNATSYRQVAIKLNGTTEIAFNTVVPVSGTGTIQVVTTIYNLSLNDYVEVLGRQYSGGALNITTAAQITPEFMMQRIG